MGIDWLAGPLTWQQHSIDHNQSSAGHQKEETSGCYQQVEH
jgi:hypothetical protein